MKRQILMAAMVGCLIAAVPSFAQTHVYRIVVKVPFPFYAGQHLYPEGDYSFGSRRPYLVMLGPADGSRKAIFLSNEVSGDAGGTGRVVFRCYRGQCFLSQLWIPGRDGGQELTPPQREVELQRRHETAVYMALLGVGKP